MIRRRIKNIFRKIKGRITQNPSSSETESIKKESMVSAEPELEAQPEPTEEVVQEVEVDVEVESSQVHEWISQGKAPLLVDIRQPYELHSGYIPDALLIPMNQLAEQVGLFPKNRPIVLYCAAGARSFGMAHFMRERGFSDSWSLTGGVAEWNDFAFPVSSAAFRMFDIVSYQEETWVVWGIQDMEGQYTYRLRRQGSLDCLEAIREEDVQKLSQ